MTNQIVSKLMIACLILIIIDLALNYYGVTYLGVVEDSLSIGTAGLIPGIMVGLVIFSFISFMLWVIRKSTLASNASITGLVLMCTVELFAVVHSIFVIFT